MGGLSPSVIVLLVIIGAGAAVALGYAVSFLFSSRDQGGPPVQSEEQTKHMRDVRQRNYDDFWEMARLTRRQ